MTTGANASDDSFVGDSEERQESQVQKSRKTASQWQNRHRHVGSAGSMIPVESPQGKFSKPKYTSSSLSATIMMFATFVLAIVSSLAAVSAVEVDSGTVPLKSLTEGCRFAIGRRNYNLCPLFNGVRGRRKTMEFENQTPPTVTKVVYDLSLDGPLERNTTLPEHEQVVPMFISTTCKRITAAINRRPDHRSEAPRILQVVPVVANFSKKALSPSSERFAVHAMLGKASDEHMPPPLWIHLTGGHYVDKPQKGLIHFICDLNAPDPSEPTFGWSFNGTHTFNWRTKHSCASVQAAPQQPQPTSPPEDAPAEDHNPPPTEVLDPPTEHDGQKLTEPPSLSDGSRHAITTILLCTTAGLFLVGYLIVHPPSPIRRRLTPYVRSFRRSRFRGAIGESKLLQWAQEDMALMEEDEMVNAHGENIFGLDEHIPLKPSPKKGLMSNYGTTR
ncbi:hypothetical protein EW146_g2971 [Bondarzewia mesenterica]|uniref:Uncharacterized protein n=1 Tax=Bondarzewia mesenterica TaxID=1095465 RepID=A0A4S4LZ51_9AGAM|nr:hypothetical protein EW146_g2971 [Bondarzewia mesenterica]